MADIAAEAVVAVIGQATGCDRRQAHAAAVDVLGLLARRVAPADPAVANRVWLLVDALRDLDVAA